jgi:hypothetical protein
MTIPMIIPFVPSKRPQANKYNAISIELPFDVENPEGEKAKSYVVRFESGNDETILHHVKTVHDLYFSKGYHLLGDDEEGFKKYQLFNVCLTGDVQNKWQECWQEALDEQVPIEGDGDNLHPLPPLVAFDHALTLWMEEYLAEPEIGRKIVSDLLSMNIQYPPGWKTSDVMNRLKEMNKYIDYSPGDAQILTDQLHYNILERMIPLRWLEELKKEHGYLDMTTAEKIKYIKGLE